MRQTWLNKRESVQERYGKISYRFMVGIQGLNESERLILQVRDL